jgi:O-antigen/teichoic acid export membrane protein
VRGVFWVLLTMGGSRLFQFAVMLILANLLVPEDFGLVALGLILVNFLIIFREFGLGAALIQRQQNLDEAYSTGLLLFPVVGFVLYIVAFIAAPIASQFFHQQQVVSLIRWMAMSIPIAGLGILPSTLVQKSLAFHRKLIPEWSSTIGYGAVAIVLALRGYGAFSMVYGQITSEVIRSVSYWIVCPVRFRWCPSVKIAKELLQFGQKVTTGTLSLYVFNNMDQFSI